MDNSVNKYENLKSRYNKLKGEEAAHLQQLSTVQQTIKQKEDENLTIKNVLTVLQDITQGARQEFKSEVDGLVTLAVHSIFSEDFAFDLQMTTDGGRLQCKPTVWETIDGVATEYTPKDEMGGSILDPIGFALRVVLQQFQRDAVRPFLLSDEPMKNVGHGVLLERAGNMVTEISHELTLQQLIITHEPELAEVADRAWRVTRTAGVSNAVIIKDETPTPKRKLIQ